MDIDQAQFNFSPTLGLAVAFMVGFLVFAVALDLAWAQFQRVLRRPKAPLIVRSAGRVWTNGSGGRIRTAKAAGKGLIHTVTLANQGTGG